MSIFTALTARDVPILSVFLGSRQEALEWADANGERWPGSRIVQSTSTGRRTIWRQTDTRREIGAERIAA